jgi:biopolymer transport protein ExbB/TolQ
MGCLIFYALVEAGTLANPLLERYFTQHPVEYVATAMFFIGMAALAIKAVDVAGQYQGVSRPLLPTIPAGGQPLEDCGPLADQLERLPKTQRSGYRVCRLRDALEYVRRSGSSAGLDDQLKYLADQDAGRAHASYGLVRMFIWAIPILGFLGTVIGIAKAMGNLAPQDLENSLHGVMAGLTIAFDTTTLALGLCIVLFFAQFMTDRVENTLLAQVDRRVEEEMTGRFEQVPDGPDGQLAAIRGMAEVVMGTSERLVERQAELWQKSIDAAQHRWTVSAQTAGEQLRASLTDALAKSLQAHARELAAAEQHAAEQSRRHWERMQHALVENTETVATLQEVVVGKAEVLGRAVDATDHVASLQDSLNHNLQALAGARNFEKTVMSLAAVIHLLNARLGELPGGTSEVRLETNDDEPSGQAA